MFCRNTRSLWPQSSLYLPTDESYYIKYIFDMQFTFLPVGVKWKVVKNVHCPPLLIDTGLMSIGPLTKKLLQKHRLVSCRRKRALSPRSLTESSAESELSRLDAHWDGLCGLVLITSSENYGKEGCETWSALPFGGHTVSIFFGQVDLELLPFITERVTNIENNTNFTPLSVFPFVWHAFTCHSVF